jgi:hypothetical protein
MNKPLDCLITGIDGWPVYLVCSDGTVLGKSGQKLKGCVSFHGYIEVDLCNKGKNRRKSVHSLVAEAFLPPSDKAVVNHKDGNKLNNDVSNLEWTTIKENVEHAFVNGLHNNPKKPVISIDKHGNEVMFESTIEAYRQTGVQRSHISKVCRGERKTAGGYKWKYANPEVNK